jgi:predicted nucleic acid-binding protein
LASGNGQMVTIDSNIAVYAVTLHRNRERALETLLESDFVSAQVLNEYANVAWRKLGRKWNDIQTDLDLLKQSVGRVAPIDGSASEQAVRLADRYQLAFYDAVLIAVALANGATRLYSEDMHHGLVIDDSLTILNPFYPMDRK